MPVITHSYVHFQTPPGPPPGSPDAPAAVTSVTKDAGAVVSFLPGANNAGGTVTSWTVTPYVSGSAQAPQVIAAASTTTITPQAGGTYRQATVTGLANGTAYTFTVKGTNSAGTGAESGQSGANTPYAGLLFGDDFNGALNGPIDPEWWLLNVASTSDEDDYYRPDHVYLDGAGHMVLKATSDAYGGKPYTSGCVQNNTRSFAASTGNTVTFETRAQICGNVSAGMWPSPWLSGTYYQQQFKTDQQQNGWNNTDRAEIDMPEWKSSNSSFETNTWGDPSSDFHTYTGAVDLSLAQHVYRCDLKPGTGTTFFLDGSQIYAQTTVHLSGAMFFMWFQQIAVGTSPPLPQYTYVDYVRIYDRNLG